MCSVKAQVPACSTKKEGPIMEDDTNSTMNLASYIMSDDVPIVFSGILDCSVIKAAVRRSQRQ
jgi:hypothetical protein